MSGVRLPAQAEATPASEPHMKAEPSAEVSERPSDDNKKHLLLAATGSVAVIKLPLIIKALARHTDLLIRVILTANAARFFTGKTFDRPTIKELSAMKNMDGVYVDKDDWEFPWTRGVHIQHIELRRWAHCLVIAPLSANTLAKISVGMCDNLLTNVVRAWSRARRIVVAPAMNTEMWKHPVTAKQIRVLKEDWGVKNGGWFEVLAPQVKALACGDEGIGAMAEWTSIVYVIEDRLDLMVGSNRPFVSEVT